MIAQIIDSKAPHLLARHLLPSLEGEEHPDAFVKTCVTRPREFNALAIYKSPGKLYRPRISLTIEANGGVFNPHTSEHVIYFDCLVLPKRKFKFFEKEKEQKDIVKDEDYFPPEIGDRILLKARRDRKKDMETVKEFEIDVVDVHWGGFIRTDQEGDVTQDNIDSVGLVLGVVRGSFERSLIIPSDYDIKKNRAPLAA